MKKTVLLLTFSLLSTWLPATIVTIGTGTATQTQPFGMYYGYERSATLYSVTSGFIQSLGWYVGTGYPVNCPVRIYIKETASTSLSSSSWTSLKTGSTLVYNGALSFPASGWQTIDVADYVHTGTKIIVLCESNYGGNGSPIYPVFRYSNATGTHEWWQGDDSTTVNVTLGTVNANRPNIQITYISSGSTVPPSGFMANAISSSQINLNWVKNAANDNVMVAFNTTNIFGTPSGTYIAGNNITGGGTVIYNGPGTAFSHSSGLSPATTYYYKAWSVHGSTPTYSTGTTASAGTLCDDITLYPTLNDFEPAIFPPDCWSLAGFPWVRSSSASGGSAMADFYTLVSGNFDLISPELDISLLTDPIITFDHAYATYDLQVDKLQLWYSTDNGASYSLLTTWLGGISGPLNTGGATIVPFVPTAGQWATKSYALPAGTNRVMFRGISLNGNNLYLDNISFQGSIPVPAITLWNGSASANWDVPGNWTPGVVPDGLKNVTIPVVSPHPYPIVNATGLECKDLTIDPGATITIAAAGIITVKGNITILGTGSLNNQGLIILKGNLDNQNPN